MTALLILAAVAGATVWLACGYIAAAANFAYMQRHWPRLAADGLRRDRRESGILVISGPLFLFVLWGMDSYRHGFVWDWPWSSGAGTKAKKAIATTYKGNDN